MPFVQNSKLRRHTMTHNEATALIFTDLTLNGHRWSLTLRQGATEKDVNDLLALAASVEGLAATNGFTLGGTTVASTTSGNGTPPARTVKGLEGVTTNAPREGEEGGRILCNRIDRSGRRYEFWAANDTLKYPALNAPAWQVANCLGVAEEDLPEYNLAGEWVAEWRISDKLNQKGNPYKDLTGLWRREDYEGTTPTTAPEPPPPNGNGDLTLEEAREAYETLRQAALGIGVDAPMLPDAAPIEAIKVIGAEVKASYFAEKKEMEAQR